MGSRNLTRTSRHLQPGLYITLNVMYFYFTSLFLHYRLFKPCSARLHGNYISERYFSYESLYTILEGKCSKQSISCQHNPRVEINNTVSINIGILSASHIDAVETYEPYIMILCCVRKQIVLSKA